MPKYSADHPPTHPRNKSSDGMYVVRLWDMFDGWIGGHKPMTWPDAVAYWLEKTDGGTKNTEYGDGDYWRIFPANTRMVVTPEFLGR